MTDLKRARTQAVWLMDNCPNPDCPIDCPDEHADLGFPEINCGTFRPPNPATIEQWEPWPIGGAHPDTWRAFSPQVPRLYVVGRVAIIAPDPDSAWRMWMSTKGKQMTHMQELLDYCKGQCNRLLYGQPCTSRRCLHRAGYEHNPQVENGTCEAFEIFVILDSIKDR